MRNPLQEYLQICEFITAKLEAMKKFYQNLIMGNLVSLRPSQHGCLWCTEKHLGTCLMPENCLLVEEKFQLDQGYYVEVRVLWDKIKIVEKISFLQVDVGIDKRDVMQSWGWWNYLPCKRMFKAVESPLGRMVQQHRSHSPLNS